MTEENLKKEIQELAELLELLPRLNDKTQRRWLSAQARHQLNRILTNY